MSKSLIIASLLLAASTSLHAQVPASESQRSAMERSHREARNCASHSDPARCESGQRERRAQMAAAREACNGLDGTERGSCLVRQMCAKAADPAKCEQRRTQQQERAASARSACQGKVGRDAGECMAQQMCATAPDPAKCQAHAQERLERRKAMHEKGHGRRDEKAG